ncbi:peptidoglycan-associated lipoprotein Pal [bacterium]|nr:peptidoglycan-associated lipoprotein Pal [bacterium]
MKRTRVLLTLMIVVLTGVLLAGCASQQQQTPDVPEVDSTAIMAEQARADSIAAVEAAREQAIADSIEAVQQAERRRMEAERLEAQRKAAEEAAAKESLQVIYFSLDKSALTDDARNALQNNAELMRKYGDWTVVVEGHCDERGATEYNLALGERRAASVKQYYVEYGIAADRIAMISYGEERPAVEGHNEKAWSQNRRAVTAVK